ncbi:MAG: hypothetical protein Cons2KO_33920 [Congregibacter sp.]
MSIGESSLTPEEIRAKVKAYALEERESIDSDFIEKRRTPAIHETHERVLTDLLEQIEYAIQHSDYRGHELALSRFTASPAAQAVSDPELSGVRRAWARATAELYRYQLGLYQGQPIAGEVEYLSSSNQSQTGSIGSIASPSSQLVGKTLSDWLPAFIEQKVETTNPGRDALDRYRHAVDNFEALAGRVAVADITGEHVTIFLRDIQRLPGRRKTKKEYRDRSVEELIADTLPPKDLLSGNTINAYVKALSSIMRWLRESHGAGVRPCGKT